MNVGPLTPRLTPPDLLKPSQSNLVFKSRRLSSLHFKNVTCSISSNLSSHFEVVFRRIGDSNPCCITLLLLVGVPLVSRVVGELIFVRHLEYCRVLFVDSNNPELVGAKYRYLVDFFIPSFSCSLGGLLGNVGSLFQSPLQRLYPSLKLLDCRHLCKVVKMSTNQMRNETTDQKRKQIKHECETA